MAYGFKRKKNGATIYCAAFRNAEERIERRHTDATSKAEARRLAERLEAEAAKIRQNSTTESRAWTVANLLDWWLKETADAPTAAKNCSYVRKHIVRHSLGAIPLAQLRPADVENFLAEKKKLLSLQSVKHLRGYLSRAFALAGKLGKWSGDNPLSKVDAVTVPTSTIGDHLQPEEVPTLLAVLEPRWRRLFAAAIFAGLRKGELGALRREDVDLQRRTITVRRSWSRNTTKGGHQDAIPVHPELAPFLKEALEESEGDLVFPGITEDTDLPKILRQGMADAGLITGFEHRCRGWRCGHRETAKDKAPRFCPKEKHRRKLRLHLKPLVRQLRFHDLRHTAVHLLFDAGLDAAVVQAMARHRDSKTTARYAHLRADWALRKIEKLSLLPRNAPQLHPIATPAALPSTPETRKAPETVVISDALSRAGDGGRTRDPRLGKPMLYH